MTAPAPIVVLSLAELDELLRRALRDELAALRAESRSSTANRLTVAEAADALRCSVRQVRRLISTGRLRAARLTSGGSSRVLVSRTDLEQLLAEAAS